MSIISGWSGEELSQLRSLLFGTKEGLLYFSLFALIAAGMILLMVRIVSGSISNFTLHVQQEEEADRREEEQLEKGKEEGDCDENKKNQ